MIRRQILFGLMIPLAAWLAAAQLALVVP